MHRCQAAPGTAPHSTSSKHSAGEIALLERNLCLGKPVELEVLAHDEVRALAGRTRILESVSLSARAVTAVYARALAARGRPRNATPARSSSTRSSSSGSAPLSRAVRFRLSIHCSTSAQRAHT